MIIANFTPDVVPWVHVGISGTLEPNATVDVDNGRGNHILNKWGDRGLLQLQFGDSEKLDEKKKDAMDIYTRFWTRQIVIFNQHNETLKNENKPYIMPSEEIEEHAKSLGIEVVGPWKLRIPVNSEEIDSLKKENEGLKSSLSEIMQQLSELSKQVQENKAPDVIEQEVFTRKYKNKGKAPFKAWAASNAIDIMTWPPERQDEVRVKWDSYGFNEPFPLDILDIDIEKS